jgi:hypothetical protein
MQKVDRDSLEIRGKNSKIERWKTSLSTDFGCTSKVDREGVVERRGLSMKEREKLGGTRSGSATETKATNHYASLGYHRRHPSTVSIALGVCDGHSNPLTQKMIFDT